MPVTARRHVRKMRGGAQSHLIEASDGYFYVVKFRNNPQHRRILVNELIAAEILSYLHISAPRCDLMLVPDEFLSDNPEVNIQLGSHTIRPEAGWAFASQHPGHPGVAAIYDFVPDSVLAQIHNLADFLAILVFDKWTGNADGRQAIFFRAQLQDRVPAVAGSAKKLGFVALMIDHGFIFNGPYWNFTESALQGLYPRRMVYESVTSLNDFELWLDRIRNFPDEVLDRAMRRIPPDWIEGEEDKLARLLEALTRRQKRIAELVGQSQVIFPKWNSC